MNLIVFASILVLSLWVANTQIAPVYDVAKTFIVGSGQSSLTLDDIQNFTIIFPTGFTVSTVGYRKPFFGINSVEHFAFESAQALYFWSRIVQVQSTSMIFQLENYVIYDPWTGNPTQTYGLVMNTLVGYRYLLIKSTFPTKYFCDAVTVLSSRKQVGGSTPFSFTKNYLLSSLTSPAPAPLTFSTDTVFLHTFTDSWINQTSTNTSSVGLTFELTFVSTTNFTIKTTTKYHAKIQTLNLMVFIYNKADFENMYIKLEYAFLTFLGLPTGTGSQLTNYYTASFLPSINNFMYGISAFEFKNYKNVGFDFSLSSVITGNQYTVVLKNLRTSSSIPRLDIVILVVKQIKCPNGQMLINAAVNSCYAPAPLVGCPTGTFASTQQIGVTGIFICAACSSTCQTCTGLATNCTSCFTLQNRQLTSNTCVPMSHYFNDGSNPIAQPCDVSCKQCMTTAIRCTQCYTDAYLNSTNSCVLCTSYNPGCLTCDSIKCKSCSTGYIINLSTGACIQCVSFDPKCSSCTPTACTGCSTDSYLQSGQCKPCTDYHSQCSTCTATGCSTCLSPYQTSPTKVCYVCADFDSQCATCTPTSCSTCNTEYFLNSSNKCQTCSTYHSQCQTCNPSACSTCISPYQPSPTLQCYVCTDFDPQCATCTPTVCSTCNDGYFLNSSNKCQACSTYHTQCQTCNPSACSTCQSPYQPSPTLQCYICTDFDPQCSTCSSTACQTCNSGFFLTSSNQCQSCLPFHSQCAQCSSSGCSQCSSGYFVDGTGCNTCRLKFGTQCSSCNVTQCLGCVTGYYLNPVSLVCEALQCGDGKWVDSLEDCDDGNKDNFDGCDDQCKIQPDYVCLKSDKFANGSSLCKFTKPITLSFSYLSKDPTSNTAHILFTLQPPTFKQFTPETIQTLLSPVQIVDQTTGQAQTIPIDSLQILFNKDKPSDQIQLIVNYNQSSIEDKFLKFNIDTDNTNIPAIKDQPSQNDLYLKLHSDMNGVDLYAYSQDTYDFGKTLNFLALAVGILSLVFMILGCFMPVGKLIVVQALAIVQISFFSVLSFQKIPPTFLSLRNLIYSNGYNSISAFPPQSTHISSTFTLIGLSNKILASFNLSLIILIFLPLLVGFAFMIAFKIISRKTQQKEQKNDSQQFKKTVQDQSIQLKLVKAITNRFLLECTFYGILITAYLAWIQTFSSFKSMQIPNIVLISIIAILWIIYGGLFFKRQTTSFDMLQSSKKQIEVTAQKQKPPKNSPSSFSTNFSEFKKIHEQLWFDKIQPKSQSSMQKLYLAFFLERILTSALIAFTPSFLKYTSVMLITLFILLEICLIVLYKKSESISPNSQRKPLFSYLYKNYLLRQSINFAVIVIIQLLYLLVVILASSEGIEKTFTSNMFVVKIIPTLILVLVLLSLCFNAFLWIWELKQEKIFQRLQIILSILCSSLSSVKSDPIKQQNNLDVSGNEQDQMKDVLHDYIRNSPIFRARNSPFLGIEQKPRRKDSCVGLLKIQTIESDSKNDQFNEFVLQQDKLMEIWDEI